MQDFAEFLERALLPGTLIAIYFGYLRFGHKIGASHSFSMNRTEAAGIREVVLTNLKDRSTPIFGLYAVQGNVVIPLIEFENPLVLKSFESMKIEVPPVSEYLLDGRPFEFH